MLRKSSTTNSPSSGVPKLRGSITEQQGDNSSPTQLNHGKDACVYNTLFSWFTTWQQYMYVSTCSAHEICEVHGKTENHIQ